MKIKSLKNEIYLDILILMLIGSLGVGSQTFFVITAIYYGWLLIRNSGKIRLPKVPGIRLYIFFIAYATVVGLFMYSLRSVLRDLYYILPTVIWIFIGYHLRIDNINNQKSLFKTLYIYGGIISLKCIITFITNPTFEFTQLRNVFGGGVGVYEIGFILPILILDVILLKKTVFSRSTDILLILLMTIQIVLSFSRIALLDPIIELCVLAILAFTRRAEYRHIASRILTLFGGILLVAILFFLILPDSVTNIFIDKIADIFTEVDSSQAFSSTASAMNNWRGYEINAAQEQWKNSNLFAEIFGAGIGKGTYLQYVPYNWKNLVVNNEIPLLHNGFYTLLIKGGIVAVVSLILMMAGSCFKGIRVMRYENILMNEGMILAAISITAIANTYVIRGPVQQGAFLTWALLVGWLNSEIVIKRRNICNSLKR